MKTPDTTTAQYVAYATAILSALVVLFKLDVSDAQQAAAITILGAVLAAFHMWSDGKIRNGRAGIAAAQITASIVAPTITAASIEHDGDDSQVPPVGVEGAPLIPPTRGGGA